MTHLLYRFVFVDVWVPVWPNVVATPVCVAGAYLLHLLSGRRFGRLLARHLGRTLAPHLHAPDRKD